jgi:copper(I)-binding protein
VTAASTGTSSTGTGSTGSSSTSSSTGAGTGTAARSGRAPAWFPELARAAAGPVICVLVLIGALCGWVASGGAGTLTPVQLKVTLAAVPMRAFSTKADAAAESASTYLVIRNLTGTPDQLVAVRTPIARRAVLTERSGPAATPVPVRSLTIPANGTLTLTPLGSDVVLEHPDAFESSRQVPLTLVFRSAGTITIEAPVTAPGSY